MSACLDKISFLLPITLHCCYFCFYTIFITFRPSGFLDIIRFLGLMHQPLVISFDNCLDDGQSCILVELNEEIEELVRECPEDFLPELYFKGGDDDDAILCTKSKTFKVKRVSTSNVLLFCRILDDRIEATATLGCYIELVRAQPDVGKLRQRLQDVSPFSGQDEPNGLSYDQISNFFRGSEVELNTSLEKIGAICFGNCWQLVEWGYGDRLLKYLIASIVAESWSLNKMPCPIIHRILKDCGATDQIISWVISRFFEPLEPKLVAISELKIARFEAEYILQSAPEKYLVLDTFLELWRKAVHSSLNIDLEMLKDLSFIDEDTIVNNARSIKVKIIRYYPKYSLPLEESERFEAIFGFRKRWPARSLLNFVDDLAPDKKSLEKILAKYTRYYNVDDEIYYTKKFVSF